MRSNAYNKVFNSSISSYLTDTSMKVCLLQIKFEIVNSLSSHSENLLLMFYQYLQLGRHFFVSKNLVDAMHTPTSLAKCWSNYWSNYWQAANLGRLVNCSLAISTSSILLKYNRGWRKTFSLSLDQIPISECN